MSFDVFLVRFRDGASAPKHDGVLREMEAAVRDAIAAAGGGASVVGGGEGAAEFQIDLDGDRAYVSPDNAAFFLHGLSPLALRLMFAVATVGDMTILPTGSTEPLALLADEGQRSHLPADFEREWRLQVCRSVEELAAALSAPYVGYRRYADHILDSVASTEPRPNAPAP